MSSGSVGGISNRSEAFAIRSSQDSVPGTLDGTDQDDMRQLRKPVADLLDLAAVQCLAGHEHPSLAHLQAGGDRLRAKGGEQGRHHASVLQRPQRCHVELRHAAGQDEYALAHADTEPLQDIGEAVGGGSQLAEAEIPALAGAPEPAKCQMIGARTPRVAIHGLVRDVQAATVGQPVQHPPRPVPLEVTADRVVVGQVRLQPKARRSLPDRRIPAAQSLQCPSL